MDRFLLDNDFSRCHAHDNAYRNKVVNHPILHVLYVHDIILTNNDPKHLTHGKHKLKNNFEMTNLTHLHYFLGLQVLQTKEGIFLS